MPTVKEASDYYKEQMRQGKGHLHTGHCYIAEDEAKKRESGQATDGDGKPKTKIAWDSSDPDSYAEWHKERRRWMDAANSNPTLSTDAMIVALKAYGTEAMKEIIDAINETRIQQSGVPRAEIPEALPDWAK